MATTVILRESEIKANGRVFFRFDGGFELEFPSLEAATEWVSEFDDPARDGVDNARRLCIAYLVARQPDLTPDAVVRNRDFVLDMSHPDPIRVL